MSWSFSNPTPRSIRFGVLTTALMPLVLVGFASTSRAQGFGPDPFRPYNSQFDPFVYPTAPNSADYGRNGPGSGVRGANQFENYLNSLQGTGSHAGAGTPYYRANRAYDREFNREYRPNREADARFEDNQTIVTDLYFKYLREKDPRKRAEIFKDYNKARSRADRDLSGPRPGNQRSNARSSRGGAPPALGTESTGTSTRDRGMGSAPSPLSSERSRTRTATGSARGSSMGPAPSPLGGLAPPANSSGNASPSQILDRATRPERSRVAPRVPSLGSPPPL